MGPRPKFQEKWLSNPLFKDWLARVDRCPQQAYCHLCLKHLSAEITSLKRHRCSKIHVANVNKHGGGDHGRDHGGDDVEEPTVANEQEAGVLDGVAYATILFLVFISKHNLPFSMCEDIMALNKMMFPDSKIAAHMALKRTKCTSLSHVLGNYVASQLGQKLQTNKFSIIIDETTDCSTNKACAILVKFYDSVQHKITTALLDLVNIYDSQGSASGEALFNIIMDCLKAHSIPISNLIGFAADGASNIMGSMNSVSSRLKNVSPGISVFKCVAHTIHLCSSEAAKTLPRVCEDLVRNVYNFFAHSAKRKFEYKEYQVFCNVKPHKLLHPSATRWLSLHMTVNRILEQWQPLKLYFTNIFMEERLGAVDKIHEALNDPSVFMYLTFLDYILPKLNNVNLLFQSKGPTLHLLHEKIQDVYIGILSMFYNPVHITRSKLHLIDPNNTVQHIPINQIYLGAALHELFNNEVYQRGTLINDVKERCKKFAIVACVEIKSRFDMNNSLWRSVGNLQPKSVLSRSLRAEVSSLTDLAREVPLINTIDRQALDNEWRCIPWHPFNENINSVLHDAHLFYKYILDVTDETGAPKFACLGKFA
ncbi:uncharacterized protein LOC143020457 [Oratosquilla oratoria]|uniref:uncharacterized protein LOC143020457 n=1 Tax=Oratosquilla oratoria TaxID=337810 RepID=UPI003F758BBC